MISAYFKIKHGKIVILVVHKALSFVILETMQNSRM